MAPCWLLVSHILDRLLTELARTRQRNPPRRATLGRRRSRTEEALQWAEDINQRGLRDVIADRDRPWQTYGPPLLALDKFPHLTLYLADDDHLDI